MAKTLFISMIIALFSSLFAQGNIKLSGDVFVNGKKIDKNSVIKIGDFIETKKNSKVLFKIGEDAFKGKANSSFKIQGTQASKTINVLKGGVLAVFKKNAGNHKIKTSDMTAGIRGTGIYVKVLDGKTYFCTCYGKTKVSTKHDHKNLEAIHHNMIWAENGKINKAKTMLDHYDDELKELEAMVGRVPPFSK